MLQLDFITNEQRQLYSKVLMENNDSFSLELYYNYTAFAWFCNIIYKDKTINGIKIVASKNILYKWKNILPFGIACITDDFSDPYLIEYICVMYFIL